MNTLIVLQSELIALNYEYEKLHSKLIKAESNHDEKYANKIINYDSFDSKKAKLN